MNVIKDYIKDKIDRDEIGELILSILFTILLLMLSLGLLCSIIISSIDAIQSYKTCGFSSCVERQHNNKIIIEGLKNNE